MQYEDRQKKYPENRFRLARGIYVGHDTGNLATLAPCVATDEDTLPVHTLEYLDSIKEMSTNPRGGDAGMTTF